MKQQNSPIVSEQVKDQNELTVSESSKLAFVEPTVSTPEDVLEATTFFQAPTVDTTSV